MSLMNDILSAVGRNPGGPVSEFSEALGTTEKRVRDNLIHARNRGLVVSKRDDVTGQPGYTLTDAGRKAVDATRQKSPAAPAATPAGGECENTGSDGSRGTFAAEAVAVQTPVGSSSGVGSTEARGAADEFRGRYLQHILDAIRDEIPNGDPLKLDELPTAVRDLWMRVQKAEETANLRNEWLTSLNSIVSQAFEAIGKSGDEERAELPQSILEVLAAERQARSALREQLDAEETDTAVDVLEAARGYLVRAPKRRPRIVKKTETAVSLAKAAAKNGSGFGDVFALVPLGRAVRGAEWKPVE